MDPEVIKELSTKISSHPNPPEPKVGPQCKKMPLGTMPYRGGYLF